VYRSSRSCTRGSNPATRRPVSASVHRPGVQRSTVSPQPPDRARVTGRRVATATTPPRSNATRCPSPPMRVVAGSARSPAYPQRAAGDQQLRGRPRRPSGSQPVVRAGAAVPRSAEVHPRPPVVRVDQRVVPQFGALVDVRHAGQQQLHHFWPSEFDRPRVMVARTRPMSAAARVVEGAVDRHVDRRLEPVVRVGQVCGSPPPGSPSTGTVQPLALDRPGARRRSATAGARSPDPAPGRRSSQAVHRRRPLVRGFQTARQPRPGRPRALGVVGRQRRHPGRPRSRAAARRGSAGRGWPPRYRAGSPPTSLRATNRVPPVVEPCVLDALGHHPAPVYCWNRMPARRRRRRRGVSAVTVGPSSGAGPHRPPRRGQLPAVLGR
jgi:hypothetical protein